MIRCGCIWKNWRQHRYTEKRAFWRFRPPRGDEQAKQNLACLGLSRVLEIAREFTGFGVLLLDLIQEGSLGLWQAVNRCDGNNYESARDFWIRFYMAKAVTLQARANGVGQKARRGLEDYKQVDERLLGELGRNPTLEEIAEQLHMELEEAESLRKMLDDARLLAQVKTPEEPEEEEQTQAAGCGGYSPIPEPGADSGYALRPGPEGGGASDPSLRSGRKAPR